MEATTLRCRLCLTCFDDPSQLQAILQDHLGCRIRECTGIYVDSSDSLTTICSGCRGTVDFIDEFRTRCRKADRNLQRLEGMAVTGWDLARSESYLYHLGELRKLLEPVKVQSHQSGGSGYLPETVFVKARDEGGFEWEELNIKQEIGDESDDERGEDDEEVQEDEEEEEEQDEEKYTPKRKRNRIEWEIEPLILAKAIHQHPVLWDTKHEGHFQTHLRDRAWTSLAETTKLNMAQLRKRYGKLNDMFHKRRWGPESQDVELYQLLEIMFKKSKRSKFELTGETRAAMAKILNDEGGDERMKLAQLFYQRGDVWNRSHPEFDNPSKWNSFSDQLNTPVDTLKRHWKCFRDIYYARRRRLLVGEIKPNHQCLQDPFYLLLEKMCSGSARSSHPLQPPPDDIEPLPDVDRAEFTNLIYAREVIWNQSHPDHPYVARREKAFNEVARLLNVTNKQLKVHWRKLRCFYNNRYSREKRGLMPPDNPLLHEPVYLTLKKMFGENSSYDNV